MALIAIAIKLDSRPGFFSQARVGENGRLFRVVKFRSMVDNAKRRQRGG
ncbi:sugar transferase [Candidatus Amarolinea dominans]